MADERRYAIIPGRRGRWYPDTELEHAAATLTAFTETEGLPWEMISPDDATAALPELKAGLAAVHRFVATIEAIADGRKPVKCSLCGSEFYATRKDARYCSGRCRSRANRGRDGTDIKPRRLTGPLDDAELEVDVTECGTVYLRPADEP